MGWPTFEQITEELIRVFQVKLAPYADVYGSGGLTAIEVVATAPATLPGGLTVSPGDPVIEVEDKPKLSIAGPFQRPSSTWGGFLRDRVMVSVDTGALTYVDAPLPVQKDLAYQFVGYAVHEHDFDSSTRGFQWLLQQVSFFAAGDRLKGSGWDADMASFPGYFYELEAEPQRIPSQASSLHAFQAMLVVRRVRLTDGTQGTGPVVGTIHPSVADIDTNEA